MNKKIKLMMRDGTYVEGKVLQASREFVTLKVKKSEPKDRFAEKEAIISTQDIGSLYIREGGTIAAPILLGIGGGIAGLALSAAAGPGDEGNYVVALIAAPACAVLGAYAGRELVRKTITIDVSQSQNAQMVHQKEIR